MFDFPRTGSSELFKMKNEIRNVSTIERSVVSERGIPAMQSVRRDERDIFVFTQKYIVTLA